MVSVLAVVLLLGCIGSEAKDYERLEHKKKVEEHCLVKGSHRIGSTQLHPDCKLYFYHIHKAGGTTMCHSAHASNFRVASLATNCNLPKQTHNYEEYMDTHNITFGAQEDGSFIPSLDVTHTLHVTVIRHPLDRIYSHLHHEFCNRKSKQDAIDFFATKKCKVSIENTTLPALIMDPCFSLPSMAYFTSNFYIRRFSNCSAFVTRECFEMAKNVLDSMSAILITDTDTSYYRYAKILDAKFGLHVSPDTRAGTRHKSNAKEALEYVRTSLTYVLIMLCRGYPDAWNRLYEMNSLDMEFYHYALNLAESQSHLPKAPRMSLLFLICVI